MIRTLSVGLDDFVIETAWSRDVGDGFELLRDTRPTADLVARLLADPHGAAILRDIAASDPAIGDASSLDDEDLIHAFVARMGELTLQSRPKAALGTFGDEDVPFEPAAREAAPDTTWVEFKVVDDRTNRPIPGVELTIVLPDGTAGAHTTNQEGLITFDPVKPGSCALRTDIEGLRLASALAHVGLGDGPIDEESPLPDGKARRLAVVERHKVRTGESLKSLAEANGMTWQALARFNFDTDDPVKINRLLRTQVGCTRRTKDGKNYVLSDSDDPGIVEIPRRLDRAGLGTGQTHVLRARPLGRPSKLFFFSH